MCLSHISICHCFTLPASEMQLFKNISESEDSLAINERECLASAETGALTHILFSQLKTLHDRNVYQALHLLISLNNVLLKLPCLATAGHLLPLLDWFYVTNGTTHPLRTERTDFSYALCHNWCMFQPLIFSRLFERMCMLLYM